MIATINYCHRSRIVQSYSPDGAHMCLTAMAHLYKVPWTHASLPSERYLDRFSRFLQSSPMWPTHAARVGTEYQ